MIRNTSRFAVLLSPLLLAVACSGGQGHTTRLLNDRLQARLAPDIEAGNAAFTALPDGAQVTLLGASLISGDMKPMGDKTHDVRASVVEGLLDPTLMRIEVADMSDTSEDRRAARVRDVERYLTSYGLGGTIQSPSQPPADSSGLTITVRVQCPGWNGSTGYSDGKSNPVCD